MTRWRARKPREKPRNEQGRKLSKESGPVIGPILRAQSHCKTMRLGARLTAGYGAASLSFGLNTNEV
jgi:hypothetical protein